MVEARLYTFMRDEYQFLETLSLLAIITNTLYHSLNEGTELNESPLTKTLQIWISRSQAFHTQSCIRNYVCQKCLLCVFQSNLIPNILHFAGVLYSSRAHLLPLSMHCCWNLINRDIKWIALIGAAGSKQAHLKFSRSQLISIRLQVIMQYQGSVRPDTVLLKGILIQLILLILFF